MIQQAQLSELSVPTSSSHRRLSSERRICYLTFA